MDFLNEQRLIYTSKENENIYKFLKDVYKIENTEFFVLCASIGFRANRKEQFDETGREFRSNYLKSSGRTTLYTILLNSSEQKISIDDFGNKENHSRYVKLLQEYAEGGVCELIDRVLKSKYSSGYLDQSYKWYIPDIMNYVLTETCLEDSKL